MRINRACSSSTSAKRKALDGWAAVGVWPMACWRIDYSCIRRCSPMVDLHRRRSLVLCCGEALRRHDVALQIANSVRYRLTASVVHEEPRDSPHVRARTPGEVGLIERNLTSRHRHTVWCPEGQRVRSSGGRLEPEAYTQMKTVPMRFALTHHRDATSGVRADRSRSR